MVVILPALPVLHDLAIDAGLRSAAPVTIGAEELHCSPNAVKHDLRVFNNRNPVEIAHNSIGHNLTVAASRPGGAGVMSNAVYLDATCSRNQPFVRQTTWSPPE